MDCCLLLSLATLLIPWLLLSWQSSAVSVSGVTLLVLYSLRNDLKLHWELPIRIGVSPWNILDANHYFFLATTVILGAKVHPQLVLHTHTYISPGLKLSTVVQWSEVELGVVHSSRVQGVQFKPPASNLCGISEPLCLRKGRVNMSCSKITNMVCRVFEGWIVKRSYLWQCSL